MYSPNQAQLSTKSTYWVRIRDYPSGTEHTLQQALMVTSDSRLRDWWDDPDFVEWFQEPDSWKIELESLLPQAVASIKDILSLTDPKSAGARVNAMKLLFEVLDKMPAKTKEVRYLDRDVDRMDIRQLEDFIKSSQKKIKGVVSE